MVRLSKKKKAECIMENPPICHTANSTHTKNAKGKNQEKFKKNLMDIMS